MASSRMRSGGGSDRERWIVLLLVATFTVVVVLFVQGLRTLRAQQSMVETMLEGFAGFAADRIATELDQTFIAHFLSYVALAREAHDRWLADPSEASERPTTGYPLPEGSIAAFFSLDDTLLVTHGTELDSSTRRSIVEQVRAHLPGYPRPAPYVVLRAADEPTAIVYRREETSERESVYGFLVDFAAPLSIYADIARRTELLPRSLGNHPGSRDLFAVGIHLAPGAPALHARDVPGGRDGPGAWAFAAKAGRLAVHARIDEERARTLVGGATSTISLSLLSILALLTASLLYAAIVLLRHSSRLTELRESFVANVSHDLRTPIAQIRMFAETLRLDRLGDPSEREQALEIVHRQTEVLEDLVDNLLHASGPQAFREPEPTDLETLATDVVDALGPAAEARGCRVDVSVVGPPEAVLDPTAATRILTNLVDNAIRHGVANGRVAVTLEHHDGVTITVEDDGPGIAPRDRGRVFERFERLAGTTATGAGIGLSVVRGLAHQYRGEARIETAVGGGTRVVVDLPTGAPRPSDHAPASGGHHA